MKSLKQFLLFSSAVLLGAQPVCRPMDLPKEPVTTLTLCDLPSEIIRKIISHVPSGSCIQERFKSVSTPTECSSYINKAAQCMFDPAKKLSEEQVSKFSKLYWATLEASDNEKEAMLWKAVNDRNYTTVSLLLAWYPRLINSCHPETKSNLIVSLFLTESLPSLDLVAQLIMTDKQVNKTETSGLINAKTNACLFIDRGYYVSFGNMNILDLNQPADMNVGLSAMDILLYRLADPFLQESDQALRKKENALEALAEYLITQGGYFSAETYCPKPPKSSCRIRYAVGANSTLSIIIPLILRADTVKIKRFELFLKGSKIDINTHQIQKGKNVLHWAAELSGSFPQILGWLIKVPKIDINYLSEEGKTALDYLLGNSNRFQEKASICLKLLQGKNAKTAHQLKAGTHNHNIQHGVPDNQPVIDVQQPNLLPGAPAPAPVPGNNPQAIQHQGYKKPSTYCIAGIIACSALIYGAYRYFYPGFDDAKEIDEDEQEMTQDDPCQKMM